MADVVQYPARNQGVDRAGAQSVDRMPGPVVVLLWVGLVVGGHLWAGLKGLAFTGPIALIVLPATLPVDRVEGAGVYGGDRIGFGGNGNAAPMVAAEGTAQDVGGDLLVVLGSVHVFEQRRRVVSDDARRLGTYHADGMAVLAAEGCRGRRPRYGASRSGTSR